MILPSGDICRDCRCIPTYTTQHRSRGQPFYVQHHAAVYCSTHARFQDPETRKAAYDAAQRRHPTAPGPTR